MCTILYMYSCETYACTCVHKCIHAFAHLPIQIHKDFASQCDCTHILTCCSHLSCRLNIFALAVAILATLLAHTCLHLSCRRAPHATSRSSLNSTCIGIPKQTKASNGGRTKPSTTWLDPTGFTVGTCLSSSVFPG